jgi:sulfite reductase (ferredoxin)
MSDTAPAPTPPPAGALAPDPAAEIEAYAEDVRRFRAGELAPAVFKARRVPRGVYEQRRDGTYMVRVRVPGGALAAAQARLLADLCRRYGEGRLHVTTRQDLQFHGVAIEDTPEIMRRLLAVDLTTKGGGGNTVRNVTACPHAGVCPAERFDVTPFVRAVTAGLIRLTGSYNLPRKYKIAFSGCGADCALARFNDLGFVAEPRDGQPGFRVFAGGGMGAQSRLADPMEPWIPAADAPRVAETVRRLFDRHGDRTNKHRARLRFAVERLGLEAFRAAYAEEKARVTAADAPPATAEAAATLLPAAPSGERPPDYSGESLAGARVWRQRQPGFVAVPLHLAEGFVAAADFAALADVAETFSEERALRATRRQSLILRFVREERVPALVEALRRLSVDVLTPAALGHFVVCAGASTCRLGLCQSRPAARACAEALDRAGADLRDLTIHVSGCPNACGQHPAAALGFYGAAQRVGQRLAPAYRVVAGGRHGADAARLASPAGTIPAHTMPAYVADVARAFAAEAHAGEAFAAFAERKGAAWLQALTERHAAIPPYENAPEFYRDWGQAEDFSLAGRGAGECGAGVFEVVREDLDAAARATAPFERLTLAARALLIVRGVDTRDPDAVLHAFEKHFVDTGLAGEAFRSLVSRGRGHAQGWAQALDGRDAEIAALLTRVGRLFETLDANLEFHPERLATGVSAAGGAKVASPAVAPTDPGAPTQSVPSAGAVDAELNLAGVACPMNFVKAKLRLERMKPGETLALVLDDGEPIRNVPASLRGEGHELSALERRPDGCWRVTVRKRR